MIAPIISRLTQPLGGQKSPCETRNRNRTRPSHRRLDHSGRNFARAGRTECRYLPPSHLRRLMAELKNEKLIRSVRPRRPKPFGGQASPARHFLDCGRLPIRHSFSRGATTARRVDQGELMFRCAPDDGEGSRPAGCLCHTPAFARLNAHLAQKFSRYSSRVAIGASPGVFAAGSGSTAVTATPASAASIVFSNLRLFDGKSDALIEGLRVIVEGRTIKSVEPAEAPLAPDARVVDCGGGVLMPGLIDAHWHAMMASLPVSCLADGGCRLHHACRGRRSEKNAYARLHQRPRHGRAGL